MKIIITGASGGIGKAVSERFLALGHSVCGIDTAPAAITHPSYAHYRADIKEPDSLPEIDDADILFNNAGLQNSGDDIGNMGRRAPSRTAPRKPKTTRLRGFMRTFPRPSTSRGTRRPIC